MVDVPLDQIGGDLSSTKMSEERLNMVPPPRVIILDALVAVISVPEEEIV